MRPLCLLVQLYLVVIIARVLLSWFPLQPGSFMSRATSVLFSVTEPVLGPLRRVLPRVGMLDLSPLVAILLITVLSRVLLRC